VRHLRALSLALLPIVARAGAAIMRVYGDRDFAVQRKEDNSPLTLADLESQRHIIEGLTELTPDIPILSEESAQAPWAERRTGASCGSSIPWTARASSSNATANSPSTLRWWWSTNPCWG
jgi:3'-phosphoadenosine 5'-phosphosulfate (PAPS) 3'-phosphatase